MSDLKDQANITEEVDNDVQGPSELDLLKQRATQMGLKFHHNIGLEKLKQMVNDKLNGTQSEDDGAAPSAKLTKAQLKMQMRKEANKLVRVRVTCMNPNKKEWQGEFFAVSNSYIGTIKKYVPFGVEWHVPEVILKMIEARQFQTFYNEKVKGRTVRKGRLVKEFGVERLPPLTEQELKELARRQAMRDGQEV